MDGGYSGGEIFDWDEANLEHTTRHGIKDFEIEDAVLDVESIEVEAKDVRASGGKP